MLEIRTVSPGRGGEKGRLAGQWAEAAVLAEAAANQAAIMPRKGLLGD